MGNRTQLGIFLPHLLRPEKTKQTPLDARFSVIWRSRKTNSTIGGSPLKNEACRTYELSRVYPSLWVVA